MCSGRLTEKENLARLEACGKTTQEEHEYGGIFLKDETNSHFRKYLIALSSRHVVVNPSSKTLGFVYDKENCKNNIQKFTIDTVQQWPGKLNDKKEAFYIGSCEYDVPRGFVIVEHSLNSPHKYSWHCLPDSPIENGSQIEVFTTLNATAHSLEFIITKAHNCECFPNEMCTEQLVTDFGGPVLDSSYENKTYVGHSFTYDNQSIHIIPVYQYLKQICEVSGICEKRLNEISSQTSSLLPSSLSKSKLSFTDSDEPVIHVNFPVSSEVFSSEPIIIPSQNFMNSEVIDGGENEEQMDVVIEEIEASGDSSEEETEIRFDESAETDTNFQSEQDSSSGEKVLILFESEELETEQNYEPLVLSVVPHEKMSEPIAPQESTIVRAEPFSAVIIPISENDNDARSEFSTPEELLIAFLIMLSLTFFVLMCLYGCVDYEGKRNYWKPYLGEIPV
uniref:ZP domain-containing protein n=1 Tax=Caenorhabditis tropicalis TaxID=1561998 RepID=A0A1I7UAP3_9PELO